MHHEGVLLASLRHSAESVGLRDGELVPLRYSPVAGELSACMRSLGLVDREDLRALRIEAREAEIDRITANRFAAPLAPGAAAVDGELRWARVAPEQAIVVARAVSALLAHEALRAELGAAGAAVTESPLVAIEVLGPATRSLLADLGEDAELIWMRFDEDRALALVEPARALATWKQLSAAGRRYGLCYVGAEAAERFELVRGRSGARARR